MTRHVCNTSVTDCRHLIMALPARLATASYLHRFLPLENIRDTLYREDESTARTRSGPKITPFRNLAIWALRPPDATTPPKPTAGPAATWTDPSSCSDLPHALETAVPRARSTQLSRFRTDKMSGNHLTTRV
jgi:hypothetical protein